MAPSADGRARPFVGLRSFTYDDQDHFFGRDRQIEALEHLIEASPLVSVIGSSGSGKSSLIRAGLLPRLRPRAAGDEAAWNWVEMRPGEEPIRRLAEALARPGQSSDAAGDDPVAEARADRIEGVLRDSSFGIREALALVPNTGDGRLVILIDQFEEIFRFADLRGRQTRDPVRAAAQRDEATFFVQLVLTAIGDPDFQERIVITMRSDFIGDCARFHGLSEAVTQTQYLVPALTRDQRATAIRAPVEQAGGTVEPALVQRLLNDTNEDPDQLPVLQHAMMRCWQRAVAALPAGAGVPLLTQQHYQDVGGVTRALSLHADEILDDLSRHIVPPHYGFLALGNVTKRLFQALTDADPQGRTTRRPQKMADLARLLAPEGADAEVTAEVEAAVRQVVLRFADPDCSFLRAAAAGDLQAGSIVDIGHEALIRKWDRLGSLEQRNWVREEQEDGERYRELLGLARNQSLLPPEKLPEFEAWWAERRPNRFWAQRYTRDADRFAEVEGVLARSRADIRRRLDEERAARRARRLVYAGFAGLLLLVLLGVGGFFLYAAERDRAAAMRESAEADAARAQLAAVLGLKSLESLGATETLLDVQYALPRSPYVPGLQAIAYAALQHLHEKLRLTVGNSPAALAFRPDGGLLIASGGRLMTVDDISRTPPAVQSSPLPKGGTTFWLSLSPDAGRVVIGSTAGLRVHDLTHPGDTDAALSDGGKPVVGQGTFSPDGRYIVTSGFNASPKLWSGAAPGPYRMLYDFGGEPAGQHKVAAGTAVGFSADSRTLAFGDKDGGIHLYDVSACKFGDDPVASLCPWLIDLAQSAPAPGGQSQQISSLAFDPVDPTLIAAMVQSGGGYLWRWNPAGGPARSVPLPFTVGNFPRAVFSPDGDTLATASSGGRIQLWHWSDDPAAAAIGPGGTPATEPGATAAASSDTIEVLQPRGAQIISLAFSPQHWNLLVTGSMDGNVRLWDTRPALSRRLPHAASAEIVALTDGIATRTPPSISNDPLASAPQLSVQWNPAAAESPLAVQPASGGAARFLDPSAWLNLQTYLGRGKPTLDRQDIRMVAISPDAGAVAVAPAEGPIYLYNLNGPGEPGRPADLVAAIAAFGGASWKWRWVGFATNPDRLVGRTLSGEQHAWYFFRNQQSLMDFVDAALPLQSGVAPGSASGKVALSAVGRCELEGKFDVTLIYRIFSDQQQAIRRPKEDGADADKGHCS